MKTIIYVGAYDGRKASMYLKDDLHAIEACPINYKECKKRLVGAKVYNIAIGAKDGMAEFNVWNRKGSPGTSQSNSFYKKAISNKKYVLWHKKILVQQASLVSFIGIAGIKHIDLIHLNCEGGEYEIFAGDNSWLNITDKIDVSFHAKNKFFNSPEFVSKRLAAYRLLEGCGYILESGAKKITSSEHVRQVWVKK